MLGKPKFHHTIKIMELSVKYGQCTKSTYVISKSGLKPMFCQRPRNKSYDREGNNLVYRTYKSNSNLSELFLTIIAHENRFYQKRCCIFKNIKSNLFITFANSMSPKTRSNFIFVSTLWYDTFSANRLQFNKLASSS